MLLMDAQLYIHLMRYTFPYIIIPIINWYKSFLGLENSVFQIMLWKLELMHSGIASSQL